jgi:hypothetical protein
MRHVRSKVNDKIVVEAEAAGRYDVEVRNSVTK